MPFPFKRILLATQGTEFDAGAERVAIDLAAGSSGRINVVMPLVSNPVYQSVGAAQEEQAEAEAAEKLQQLRRAAQANGVEFAGRVRRGEEPFREIVDAARELPADLLVLRRRGKRSYLANLLLGEMVHKVISHAPCDALMVPRATQLWSRGILLATDGSPHSDRATAVACALAIFHGLPLTVLSVAEGGQDAAKARVEAALETARAAGAEATGRVVTNGKAHEAILAAARDAGADLVVIGRRGLGRFEHALLGSTSEQVASRAGCPVLIIHEAGAPIPA
ncbi:MAG TPA: universal stress protein [Rhodocyclaceae bacterium]